LSGEAFLCMQNISILLRRVSFMEV
jgi:hypothetical protein